MSQLVGMASRSRQRQVSRPERRHHVFLGVCALVFTASAGLTLMGSMSMSAMGAVPMPGGWTLSMVWLRMCGQTWPGVAASFLDMWLVMMVAMMLPSLVPMLWRYREAAAVETGSRRLGSLTALACLGYFAVWTVFGMAVFVLGVALAAIAMKLAFVARVVPVAGGLVVMLAGALQFSAWKARHLACCSAATRGNCRTSSATLSTGWQHGLHLGLRCVHCCAGLTAILLVIGVMDWRAMTLVTVAITAERLAPNGKCVAHVIGATAMSAGVFLIIQASGLA